MQKEKLENDGQSGFIANSRREAACARPSLVKQGKLHKDMASSNGCRGHITGYSLAKQKQWPTVKPVIGSLIKSI